MTAAFTIVPRGPFSLAQARDFLGAFRPAGQPADDVRFDLVVDGAVVRLREDGALTAERYDDPALEEPDAFAAFPSAGGRGARGRRSRCGPLRLLG